jgi:hypothetical protein
MWRVALVLAVGCGRVAFDARNDGGVDGDIDAAVDCLTLPTNDPRFCGPLVLATGQFDPFGLAITDTHVYWLNAGDGRLSRCAKTGCANSPTLIAQGDPLGYFVTTDATHVYWNHNNTDEVLRCPLDGCPNLAPQVLASINSATRVAVDSTYLYTSTNDGRLVRVIKTGGTPQDLVTGLNDPTGIWMSGSDMLMTLRNGNAVVRVPLAGGMATTLIPNQTMALTITADAQYMYYSTQTQIVRADLDGQNLQPLAAGDTCEGIAVDATHVYFTTQVGGTLEKVPIVGGTKITMLANLGQPAQLAIDENYVYFADNGTGNIHRVPK